MSVPILTTASTIQCPHGGTVQLQTSDTLGTVQGAPMLMVTDVHTVVGCPFTVGPKYSPCVTVRWSAGAMQTKISGTSVLLQTSVGTCYNAEQTPQGIAIINQVQPLAQGL